MSNAKAKRRQRKMNSPKSKAKVAKRRYYQSAAAQERWEEKKARKAQKRYEQTGQ